MDTSRVIYGGCTAKSEKIRHCVVVVVADVVVVAVVADVVVVVVTATPADLNVG